MSTLLLITFNSSGEACSENRIDPKAISEIFVEKLSRVSGSLDLPLEFQVSDCPPVNIQICSTSGAAYSVYYMNDIALYTSLILTGSDPDAERELADAYRYLLLDETDEETPSEDFLEEILELDAFDFEQFSERPILHQIPIIDNELADGFGEDDISSEELLHKIRKIDEAIAVSFLNTQKLWQDG